MFQIQKKTSGTVPVFHLIGEIDENVNLEDLIQFSETEAIFHTKGVTRINSAGARSWIYFFESLQKKGIHFSFTECSPAIVDQMNLIANFRAGGKVISIYVPFSCKSCKSELFAVFPIAQLVQSQGKVPDLKCSKCGGNAHFDEIEDEYLGFLKRLK